MKAHHPNMQVKVFVSAALGDLQMKKQIKRILEAEKDTNVWLAHALQDFNVKLVRLGRASKVAYLSKKKSVVKEENRNANKTRIRNENPKSYEEKQRIKFAKLRKQWGSRFNPLMVGTNTVTKRNNIRKKQEQQKLLNIVKHTVKFNN